MERIKRETSGCGLEGKGEFSKERDMKVSKIFD